MKMSRSKWLPLVVILVVLAAVSYIAGGYGTVPGPAREQAGGRADTGRAARHQDPGQAPRASAQTTLPPARDIPTPAPASPAAPAVANPPPPAPAPASYRVVSTKDVSIAGCSRTALRMVIQDRNASAEQVRGALLEAAKSDGADKVMVFAYWPGDDTTFIYTAGRLEWGQDGRGWDGSDYIGPDGRFDQD